MITDFRDVVDKLRSFFNTRGFIEVNTDTKLSILAACEDPTTIVPFGFGGLVYPQHQTGQMELEKILLQNPFEKGFYTVSTSFRNEPDPVEGRHDKVFRMFEFEMQGDIEDLINFEADLLDHLGFKPGVREYYSRFCQKYGVTELTFKEENAMDTDYEHRPVSITHFPETTSPFWNMKRTGQLANKVDIILHGIETIGSAERETDPAIMRDRFMTISGGEYSKRLFSEFGKQRVLKELEEFLSMDFFPRSGGGIGMTRMIRAMQLSKLLHQL